MKRLLECGTLLRVYTMVMALLYGVTMSFQEESLIYRVAHSTDFSLLAAYAMCVFAVMGLIDVFVNDILPESYVIYRALRDRHLVSMGISLCFGIELFTEVKYELPFAAMPFFITYAILIPVSAFADVLKRYKSKECSA